MDWIKFGKPSVLGVMTGMVAGLGMIAAGAGFVSPLGAMLIGIIAGVACFYAIQLIKQYCIGRDRIILSKRVYNKDNSLHNAKSLLEAEIFKGRFQ